jgi:hypothetical protein
MQKEEFIKIVNAMIDARIKKILPVLIKREMDECKHQLMKEIDSSTRNIPEEIDIPDLAPLLHEDAILPKRTQPAPKIEKTFTKNPKINAILQKTAEELESGKIKTIADDEYAKQQYKQILAEQYQEMMKDNDGMETFNFNTSDMSSIVSNRSIVPPKMSEELEKRVALEIEKKQIEAATGNPELGGIIMRDYRSLLKAVDEKTKAKRPGA